MRGSVPRAAAPDSNRPDERRLTGGDRRRGARGGRRASDVAGRCPTVIVAEKYAAVRQAMARYLDLFKFDVREAINDLDLTSLLNSVRPALVILDANVLEFADAGARDEIAQRLHAGVPVILTRSAPSESADEGVAIAPATNLAKPFNLSTLLDAVRRTLRAAM